MLTLSAYAKINLTLEVLGKRSDGYHETRSVMQALTLSDKISFKTHEKTAFVCDNLNWEAEKSLVSRALESIKQKAKTPGGVLVSINKHIPLSSGLGGDSSDAAVVLVGLNLFWKLGIPHGELLDMASALGSDVPFFITGGAALAQGRGERITGLPRAPRAWVVLLMPHVERPASKTAALYASLKPESFTDGARTAALVERLNRGEAARPEDLFNVFETVAYKVFNGLAKYRDGFQKIAGTPVHLAGAGPCLFAWFNDSEKAAGVWQNLKERGLEAHLAETQNSVKL